MKIPITYPAASIAIIGATVTMLTSIIEGSSSGSCELTREFTNSLYSLAQIPLSRICANLRKNYSVLKT